KRAADRAGGSRRAARRVPAAPSGNRSRRTLTLTHRKEIRRKSALMDHDVMMQIADETNRTRRPFVLAEAIGILRRTPVVIDALLRGLPDNWVTADEGVGTWSPFDVVGHLIHGERTNWMPRARIIL